MATTLATLNALINDRRRDTTSNTIDMTGDGFRAINSALDIWSSLHDWPWTIKTVNFNYNPGIDKYALNSIASDFKSPLTIKPYKKDVSDRELWMVSQLKFDSATTKPNRFAVANENGIQYLRCKTQYGTSATIHSCTDYDDDGTWVGATAISNVGNDEYEGYSLPSSVKFDYSGTSGTLTNDSFSAVDLSSYKNRSNLYFDIYIPESTNLTGITLKWGSSNANYYQVTSTTNYVGESFSDGWNRVRFSWNSPTTVGTPVDSAIDYLQVTIAYSIDPALTDFRIQNFVISENVPLTLTYYSTNMVYDVSGATQLQKFNDAADTTDYPLWSGRWDTVTEQFVTSVLEIIFFMTGEYADMSISRNKIQEIVEPLKARYPSQVRYPATFITSDINL